MYSEVFQCAFIVKLDKCIQHFVLHKNNKGARA